MASLAPGPWPLVAAALVLLTRRGTRVARIYSLVVAPAARGQGLARALVLHAERAARRAGCRQMVLEVRAANRAARALYESLGYAQAERLPGYYEDGAPGLRLRRLLSARQRIDKSGRSTQNTGSIDGASRQMGGRGWTESSAARASRNTKPRRCT